MKTFASISFAFLVLLGAAFAQLPSQVTLDTANRNEGTVRDGFTLVGEQVMITRNGVTDKVLEQFTLMNGDQIYPSGEIRGSNGAIKHLRANQLLTLDGEILDVPVNAEGKAILAPQGEKNR